MPAALPPGSSSRFAPLGRPLFALGFVLRAWARLLLTSAMLLVGLVSRQTWRAHPPEQLAHALVRACWPLLPRFTLGVVLFAGLTLPMLRATLLPLGLGPLGSDIVVRLFLAELLPWACAWAVLLKHVLPQCAHLCRQTRGPGPAALASLPMHHSRFMAAHPTLLAALFSLGLLFLCNAVLLLVLDLLVSHGPSLRAVSDHAAHIGAIFTPVFSLVLLLKMLLFAVCTVVFPLTAYVAEFGPALHNSHVQLRSLVRVVLSLLLVDVLALLAWYA